MGYAPRLKDYDVKVLAVLGNQTNDTFYRFYIKSLMIQKILELHYPLFYLVTKFSFVDKILKEVYAEVIVMTMLDKQYDIDDLIVDEIVELVSLDTLVCYGMQSCSIKLKNKCHDEFCRIALEIEDKEELNRKINLGKRRIYKIKNIRKGE